MQKSSPLSTAGRYAAVAALAASLATAPATLLPAESAFTLAAHAEESDNTQTVTTADGATVTGVKVLEEGNAIEVTGTGWKHPDGTGSYVSIKADKGTTTRDGNGVIAEVEANTDGTFKATISFPSTANGYNTDWAVGTTHTLHFLSGSMKDGDTVRSPVLKITVSEKGEDPTTVVDTSDWTELTSEGASIKIRPYTSGEKLRIIGQGWTKQDGASGSVVAIKLGSSSTTYFERADNSAQNAYLKQLGLSELGDDHTAWVLLTSDASAVNEAAGIYQLKDDGSFDLEIEAPEALKTAEAGSYLTLQALSGRFAPGDTKRSAVSNPIPVNGKAYEKKSQNDSQQCTTTAASPSMTIENPTVEAGGKLHLLGSGWCNPDGKGAPRIAIKIDEAKISHLDTAVHSNKTIWAIIDPNETTGEVDAWVQLPAADGSDSNIPLSEGAHSLRLLSGSLETGDLKSSYGGQGVLDFVVGKYKPNAVPDTVSTSDMSEENRKDVSVTLEGQQVTVTVPGGQPGQWVQANPYTGGSIRSNWGSGWVQLDENRQLTYQMPEGLPGGDYKMVVQNGEKDDFGSMLGWDDFTIAGGTSTASDSNLSDNKGTSIAMPVKAQSLASSAAGASKASSSSSNSGSSNSGSNTGSGSKNGNSSNQTGGQSSGQGNTRSSGSGQSQSSEKKQTVVVAAPKKTQAATSVAEATAQAKREEVKKVSSVAQASKSSKEDSKATSSASASSSASSKGEASEEESTTTLAAGTEKTFWQKAFSANNLLMMVAAGVLLLAVTLVPRKKN